MPVLTKEPATAAPLFIGLQSYTEAQASIFFGRDEEVHRLTNLIKANTLTIVFGKSGTGKTSLLNAGVFPRLRKDYCLPFRIRLEFNDDSPDLVSQIKKTLKEEIDKYGFKVESYPGDETLWEYFHREQLWKSVTPILIFDQFEEIFTLAKRSTRFTKKELDAFWEELANLIENSIPEGIKERFLDGKESLDFAYKVQKIKTLFSFREEFLPEFEGITARIPSLKYSRFRLLPMNGNQAYEVVTKTWKNNINAAEADKIVEFFSTDEGPHQPYELMMIEPSLLSQVCSLIEKERLQQGKEKISSEFLDKYSKEFILRSIYDEAMAESNAAVLKSNNGLPVVSKPVNEFAEDKLITDEGYRIKYALSENDERILPGLVVLRSKYFVRDEGKSIELTHDVLTPLIKRDREERRKELALTKARKKARQRLIFITAFAGLAAWGLLYFITHKAIQKRDEADQQAAVLNMQIEDKKDSLKRIDSTIREHQKNDSANKEKQKPPLPVIADSALQAQFSDRMKNDSLQLASLTRQLTTQKKEGEAKDSLHRMQFLDFTTTKKKADSVNRSARREIALLQNRLAVDSGQLAWLRTKYEELGKAYQNFQTDYPDVIRVSNPSRPFDVAADTNSLKLDLYYSGANAAKVPDNLRVYLIPDIAANKKIIAAAETYEIRCDEMNLDRAKDGKLARYFNGNYVFLNVPPGKYFIKICAYYGGYYTYTKTKSGNVSEKLDASPPIR
ncbi:ATP-binding protein [Flavisolibacter ginsenosidimutans]|uniref:Novel STAND NTPase 1 domain-containing protein n=1 Tax=Flavisolibacter ginsenosidimutans TaxID=661481 RepID=A0A5B8ULM6_9BACT|nr:ATP-binding protein [Flavisolibacter ginsenosidimutans]QEC57468.1 hypothetical protein FSB75_16700 [Flavisolibacter ginsenosidimutans]